MLSNLKALVRAGVARLALEREEGQALVEYALILALIALVVAVALSGLATAIGGLLNTIAGDL